MQSKATHLFVSRVALTQVAEAFVTLHDKGLVYRGTYMVNWAPKLQARPAGAV